MRASETRVPPPSSLARRCIGGAILFLLPALAQIQAPPQYTITTMAGTGTAGYDGDGAAAGAAQLYSPVGMVMDSAGNLYVSDQLNDVVRKIAPDGTITTAAGDGVNGYTGDGGAATSASLSRPTGLAIDNEGNLYIADTGNHVIRKVTAAGTISTIAGNGTAGFDGDLDEDEADEDENTDGDARVSKPGKVSMQSRGSQITSDSCK